MEATVKFVILLFYIHTIFMFSIFTLNSQQTNKWEVVDKNEYKFSNDYKAYYPKGINMPAIAYRNENNILVAGNKVLHLERSYKNDSGELDTAWCKVNDLKLFRFINKAKEKEEIEVPEFSAFDNIWTSISYPTDNHIFIAGDDAEFLGYFNKNNQYKFYARVLISRDNGNSWTTKYLDSNYHCKELNMIDSVNGFLSLVKYDNYYNRFGFSDPYTFLVTHDGWETYEQYPVPEEFYGSYYIIDKNNWIFPCYDDENNQMYLKITNDGGDTWETSNYFSKYEYLQISKFIGKIGYCYGSHDIFDNRYYRTTLKKSTDGGFSWIDMDYSESNELQISRAVFMDWSDENNGICMDIRQDFIRTTDGGDTWFKEYYPSKFTLNNDIDVSTVQFSKISNDFTISLASYDTIGYVLACKNEKTLLKPEFYYIQTIKAESIEPLELSWSRIEGAKSYRFKFDSVPMDSNSAKFENPKIDTLVTDTTIIIKDLLYHNRNSAWVQAIGEDVESDWDHIAFLTINNETYIEAPDIIYPEPNSYINEGNISFVWKNNPDADSYSLNVEAKNKYKYKETVSSFKDTSYVCEDIPAYQRITVTLSSNKAGYQSYPMSYVFYTIPGTVDVEEISTRIKGNEIFIYPNPTSDYIYLNSQSKAEITKIKIFSVLGVKMMEADYNDKIDVSELPTGVYFLKYNSRFYKFVKL
jgi:hypothetical protein